jgi:hypothetical protein
LPPIRHAGLSAADEAAGKCAGVPAVAIRLDAVDDRVLVSLDTLQ